MTAGAENTENARHAFPGRFARGGWGWEALIRGRWTEWAPSSKQAGLVERSRRSAVGERSATPATREADACRVCKIRVSRQAFSQPTTIDRWSDNASKSAAIDRLIDRLILVLRAPQIASEAPAWPGLRIAQKRQQGPSSLFLPLPAMHDHPKSYSISIPPITQPTQARQVASPFVRGSGGRSGRVAGAFAFERSPRSSASSTKQRRRRACVRVGWLACGWAWPGAAVATG